MLENIGINPNQPLLKDIPGSEIFITIREIVESAGDLYVSDLFKTAGNLYKLFGLFLEKCSEPTINYLNETLLYTKPISRAIHFFSSNYPAEISIKCIADHTGLSRSHFATQFKKEVGCSPSEFLTGIRLQHARQYLTDSSLSIAEVAHSVGFQDALYFTKVFHKMIHCTPSEYRKHNTILETLAPPVST